MKRFYAMGIAAGLVCAAISAQAADADEITLSGKLGREGTKYVLTTKDGIKVMLPANKAPAIGKEAAAAKKLAASMRKLVDKDIKLIGKGQIKQTGESRTIDVVSITSVSGSATAPKKEKKRAPKPKAEDDADDDMMDDDMMDDDMMDDME